MLTLFSLWNNLGLLKCKKRFFCRNYFQKLLHFRWGMRRHWGKHPIWGKSLNLRREKTQSLNSMRKKRQSLNWKRRNKTRSEFRSSKSEPPCFKPWRNICGTLFVTLIWEGGAGQADVSKCFKNPCSIYSTVVRNCHWQFVYATNTNDTDHVHVHNDEYSDLNENMGDFHLFPNFSSVTATTPQPPPLFLFWKTNQGDCHFYRWIESYINVQIQPRQKSAVIETVVKTA